MHLRMLSDTVAHVEIRRGRAYAAIASAPCTGSDSFRLTVVCLAETLKSLKRAIILGLQAHIEISR